jgi:hypothetical protein
MRNPQCVITVQCRRVQDREYGQQFTSTSPIRQPDGLHLQSMGTCLQVFSRTGSGIERSQTLISGYWRFNDISRPMGALARA